MHTTELPSVWNSEYIDYTFYAHGCWLMSFGSNSNREWLADKTAGWISAGAGAAILIASGLLAWFLFEFPINSSFDWSLASLPFLGLVCAGAFGFFLHLAITWSVRHALLLLGVSLAVSTIAELMGLGYGLVFGEIYFYHPDLQPRIAGVLPIVIPIAWFILSCLPVMIFRPWLRMPMAPIRLTSESRRTGWAPGRWLSWALPRAVLCAVLLAGCDLYLEPLSVYSGSWQWTGAGDYFGAPLSNLAGWVLVGLCIYLGFLSMPLPREATEEPYSRALDALLLVCCAVWMTVALILTGTLLDSMVPLALTFLVWAPAIRMRYLHIVRKRGAVAVCAGLADQSPAIERARS